MFYKFVILFKKKEILLNFLKENSKNNCVLTHNTKNFFFYMKKKLEKYKKKKQFFFEKRKKNHKNTYINKKKKLNWNIILKSSNQFFLKKNIKIKYLFISSVKEYKKKKIKLISKRLQNLPYNLRTYTVLFKNKKFINTQLQPWRYGFRGLFLNFEYFRWHPRRWHFNKKFFFFKSKRQKIKLKLYLMGNVTFSEKFITKCLKTNYKHVKKLNNFQKNNLFSLKFYKRLKTNTRLSLRLKKHILSNNFLKYFFCTQENENFLYYKKINYMRNKTLFKKYFLISNYLTNSKLIQLYTKNVCIHKKIINRKQFSIYNFFMNLESRLINFLVTTNLVSTFFTAKRMIIEGLVSINGFFEYNINKQIYCGDIVELKTFYEVHSLLNKCNKHKKKYNFFFKIFRDMNEFFFRFGWLNLISKPQKFFFEEKRVINAKTEISLLQPKTTSILCLQNYAIIFGRRRFQHIFFGNKLIDFLKFQQLQFCIFSDILGVYGFLFRRSTQLAMRYLFNFHAALRSDLIFKKYLNKKHYVLNGTFLQPFFETNTSLPAAIYIKSLLLDYTPNIFFRNYIFKQEIPSVDIVHRKQALIRSLRPNVFGYKKRIEFANQEMGFSVLYSQAKFFFRYLHRFKKIPYKLSTIPNRIIAVPLIKLFKYLSYNNYKYIGRDVWRAYLTFVNFKGLYSHYFDLPLRVNPRLVYNHLVRKWRFFFSLIYFRGSFISRNQKKISKNVYILNEQKKRRIKKWGHIARDIFSFKDRRWRRWLGPTFKFQKKYFKIFSLKTFQNTLNSFYNFQKFFKYRFLNFKNFRILFTFKLRQLITKYTLLNISHINKLVVNKIPNRLKKKHNMQTFFMKPLVYYRDQFFLRKKKFILKRNAIYTSILGLILHSYSKKRK